MWYFYAAMTRTSRVLLCGLFISAASLLAQRSEEIRPIPPPGVEVPERVRPGLEAGLARLEVTIGKLGENMVVRRFARFEIGELSGKDEATEE